MLNFDETTHTYTNEAGDEVPSVTRILRELGLTPDYSDIDQVTLDYAAERGRAVHRACELVATGRLDESSLDPVIAGYVSAFRTWWQESKARILEAETIVHSKAWHYAGRLDLLVEMDGRELHQKYNVPAIIDIKTSKVVHRSEALQAAAYRLAYNELEKRVRVHRMYSLHLNSDESFHLVNLGQLEPSAEDLWKAAVTLYNWRRRHVA